MEDPCTFQFPWSHCIWSSYDIVKMTHVNYGVHNYNGKYIHNSHCSSFWQWSREPPFSQNLHFWWNKPWLPLAGPLLLSGRGAFIRHKAAQTLDKLHLKCEEAQRPHRLVRNLRLIQFADTRQSKHQAQIAECCGGRRGRYWGRALYKMIAGSCAQLSIQSMRTPQRPERVFFFVAFVFFSVVRLCGFGLVFFFFFWAIQQLAQ